MTQPADIESDPFLVLLTDALRAGPGSPQWHDAVAKLKTGGEQVDEYRLLINAREALESGKDYRSVRAGPEFTRKLLTNIKEEVVLPPKRPFPIAGTIALLAGLVILVIAGVAVFELYPRGAAEPGSKAIKELASTYFSAQVISSTFDNGIPAGWRSIGSLPLDATGGLRASAGAELGGGGIVTTDSVPEPFAVTVNLRLAKPGEGLVPQVFVSNSPEFSADRATSPQEIVWQLQDQEQAVVVAGRVEKQVALPAHMQTVNVRVVVSRDVAIVESNGQRLWAGPVSADGKPRYVGVRFIRTDPKASADVSIQSVKVDR